jgi:hypothetical protein
VSCTHCDENLCEGAGYSPDVIDAPVTAVAPSGAITRPAVPLLPAARSASTRAGRRRARQDAHGAMAKVIRTEPALNDLDAIADYIALDNPSAARELGDMTMHKQKRKALEADGWKVGTAQEFCVFLTRKRRSST